MGSFEIFIGTDGQFYFRLKAENGEIIASSQGYTTKQSARMALLQLSEPHHLHKLSILLCRSRH